MDERPVSIPAYEPLARARLDPDVWAYVSGGAADEHTLGWNTAAWRDLQLLPRVLVDVSDVRTDVTASGLDLPHPILIAPTAAHVNYHPDGEAATLAGAAAAEALPVMSSLGSSSFEEIRDAAEGPWWLQLYLQRDRGFSRSLVERAVDAGAAALVLTVDTPLLGARDRDRRHGGHTVDGLEPPILTGAPPSTEVAQDAPAHRRVYNRHLDPSLTWSSLAWLVDVSPVPVWVKGVLRPDDAARAVDHGVGGVIVSNHGARNLDTVPPTAAVLPAVVAACDGRVPVLVDGGIRRGTDVAKALALGASAVLVGRPVIWGLAVDGAAGVQHVVETLRAELVMAMALLGAPDIASLTPDLLASEVLGSR